MCFTAVDACLEVSFLPLNSRLNFKQTLDNLKCLKSPKRTEMIQNELKGIKVVRTELSTFPLPD